jgi:hypothetical protein
VTSRLSGDLAVTTARIADPEPGVRYRIHAAPMRPGIEFLSPTSVVGTEAKFVYRSAARGWAGLRVWAERD